MNSAKIKAFIQNGGLDYLIFFGNISQFHRLLVKKFQPKKCSHPVFNKWLADRRNFVMQNAELFSSSAEVAANIRLTHSNSDTISYSHLLETLDAYKY